LINIDKVNFGKNAKYKILYIDFLLYNHLN